MKFCHVSPWLRNGRRAALPWQSLLRRIPATAMTESESGPCEMDTSNSRSSTIFRILAELSLNRTSFTTYVTSVRGSFQSQG